MKVRINFFIYLVLVPFFPLFSQQITVSDELPLRSDIGYEIIGQIGDEVLLFRDKSITFEVQAFDQNMRSSWTKEIELLKRAPEVLGINTLRDSFTIFYRHKEQGTTYIRAQRYDGDANLQDSSLVGSLGGLFLSPELQILRSDDRSKILIYFVDRQKEIQAYMFDNKQMKTLWEYRFEPQDFRYSEDVLHMVVSNEGDLFTVVEKEEFRIRNKNHNYEVFHFGPGMTSIKRSSISLQDQSTYDLYFNYDNFNHQLVAGGFYYDKNPMRAEGFFFAKMDRSTLGSQVFFHSFDNFLVEGLLGKEIRKNKGLEEISIRDLVVRQDGGIVILGEENKNYYRRMANTGRSVYDGFTRSVTDFYYNDIFAISIHPSGSAHWQTIMHKKQYSQDDSGAYSSYFLFKNPRNLRLIFNDEIKLENTVSEYVLIGDGTFNRNSILSTENQKLRLRFRDAIQVSPSKMLVPSEHRGKLRIARLEL